MCASESLSPYQSNFATALFLPPELPLRQSWDRLQRCNRAEMPNDTGRLSDLSDRLPMTLPMAPGSVQGGTITHPTDGETNAQTLEAKCLESHRELRQPTGHPSSSAGFSALRSPRRLCSMKPVVRAAGATGNMPRQLFGKDDASHPEDSGPSWPRAALCWETQGLDIQSWLGTHK